MPEYRITIDGNKYNVKSDKPLTDAQAYEYALKQSAVGDTIVAPVIPVTANLPFNAGAETARSVGQGLTLGFADELEAALRTGQISGPEYETLRNQLRAQQESFAKQYPKTAIASEIAGGLAMPTGAFGLATKAPSIARSALTGLGLGATQGAGKSKSEEELASDIVSGGLTGGALGGTLGTIGAAIAPKIQPGARKLQQEGVSLTPGAAFGGQIQAIEQAAESLPIAGGLVKGARRQSFEDFNRAAFNRALRQVDNTLEIPKDMPTRQAADFTQSIISSKYDEIYPQVKLELNKNLNKQLDAVKSRYTKGKIGEENYAQLESRINEIKNSFGEGPLIGARIKAIKQDLASDAMKYKQTTGDKSLLADAFDDLENSFITSIRNQNPTFAKDLKKTDTAYANYKRAELAAASGRGEEGLFTPAQLETAVRQSDKSKGKSQYARGKALMQDLSGAGYDVLGTKVPDSGTAARLGVAGLLTGGAGYLEPSALIPTAIATGLYTKPGMKYAMPLLTAPRPQAVEQYGGQVRAALPYAVPGFGTLGGLLKEDTQ